jgi:hypothetical protein
MAKSSVGGSFLLLIEKEYRPDPAGMYLKTFYAV